MRVGMRMEVGIGVEIGVRVGVGWYMKARNAFWRADSSSFRVVQSILKTLQSVYMTYTMQIID